MSLVRRNAQILLGTELLTRLVLFVVIVQLANSLGDERYGQLAYVFAIANLCVVLANFGIHTYTTRVLARSTTDWLRQRHSLIILKLIGSVMAWIITISIVALTHHVSLLLVAAGALAIVATNGRMFSEAIARGQQQMQLEGYSKIIHALLLSTVLWVAMLLNASLLVIGILYAIVSVVGWGCSVWLVRRPLWQKNTTTSTHLKPVLLAVMPFAVSIALNAQFNYFDSAILGWWYAKEVLAWYTAAYKPIFFMTAVAGLIITAFFPHIVQLWQQQQFAAARASIIRLLTITSVIGLVSAILGSFLADTIIGLLYIPEYDPATLPFIILLWSTACIFIWAPLGNGLQACGYEHAYTKNFIIAAVFNIPVTMLLVWQYSLIGAAIATGLTQLLLVILMAKSAHTYLWKNTV